MSSQESPQECKQPLRRPYLFNRIRARASSILPFNSRPWKNFPDDLSGGADVTHLEDRWASPVKLLQRLFLPFHTSYRRPKPGFSPTQPYFSPEGSSRSESSAFSLSIHSVISTTPVSARSDSGTRSTISTSTSGRGFGRLEILVRGHEEVMPEDALGMNAWLDTGSVRDLMDYRHFDRLKVTHNIRLEPSDVDIVTLNDEEIEVHGIARNVVWQLREGYKTYHSDFYVLKMDQYDVLAGWDTIFKYELLKLGPDIKSHNDKTREKEKHRRRRQRELTKNFPGI